MQTMTPDQIEQAAEAAWQDGYHDDHHDYFKDKWLEGFRAHFAGMKESDNPHEPSGHERETTYSDECHFQWYSGWWKAYSVAHKEQS